jgi:hypothetical protein
MMTLTAAAMVFRIGAGVAVAAYLSWRPPASRLPAAADAR